MNKKYIVTSHKSVEQRDRIRKSYSEALLLASLLSAENDLTYYVAEVIDEISDQE